MAARRRPEAERSPLVHVVDDVPGLTPEDAPVLVHTLDGFLNAGGAGRLAAEHLAADQGRVVATFDLDAMYDYRARRPPMVFTRDHYERYDTPRLVVRLLHDESGRPYLLMAGPEPDYRWEGFASAVRDLIDQLGVSLVVGMGSVPMGVPHTRPVIVTMHGTKPELLDRTNLWSGELLVPTSAQSLMEFRLGQWGLPAVGFVAHVPHYLGQVDFPSASIALLEAVGQRAGLSFDLDGLRTAAVKTLADIDEQVEGQEGGQVVTELEEQYDSFTRGAGESLLSTQGPLPSAEELGRQVEHFLAQMDSGDERE